MEDYDSEAKVLSASLATVYLRLFGGLESNELLATASGFVVVNDSGSPFLVTNRHVVRGRHQESDGPESNAPLNDNGLLPHTIDVEFSTPHRATGYEVQLRLGNPEEIQDSYGRPEERWTWLEHPIYGGEVDVVAIPLPVDSAEFAVPYHVNTWPPRAQMWPTTQLYVVGYPLGHRASGSLAVWTSASIASEPSLKYRNLPAFLIDARTRTGQSGSPVVHYRAPDSTYVDRFGGIAIGTGQHRLELVGVYSGRIHAESDIGIVWRSSVINDIVSSSDPSS